MTTALIMLLLINQARSSHHQLKLSADLNQRAQHRAETLCKLNQWSHAGLEDVFKGTNYQYAGENLAKGFATPQLAEKALMASPEHKANIVRNVYTKLGIGQDCGIIVQLFEN